MTATPTPRTAAIQLRGGDGPAWARLYWPPNTVGSTDPPLLVFLPGDTGPDEHDARCRQLCLSRGQVILTPRPSSPRQEALAEARAMVEWAADHAGELDADPSNLLIAGTGRGAELAAEVVRLAADEGWPELTLIDLHDTLEGTLR